MEEQIENMKRLYPSVEYVDTAFIIQSENDGLFDACLYDEWSQCSDTELERCGFNSWGEAQQYIEQCYDLFPQVYFNRLFDLDRFIS